MNAPGYEYYSSWKGWNADSFGECSAAAGLYFAAELKRCGIGRLKGVSVLELGFGDGRFAAWAHAQGAHYRGTEAIPDLVAQGEQCGYRVFGTEVPIPNFVDASSLDVAVSFDVFEHVELDALKTLLGALYTALRPGGLVLARMPSGDSPFSRAIQHGDLTHRTVLGSSSVHQLAQEAGFTVAYIRAPVTPLRGLGALVWVRRFAILIIRRIAYPVITKAFMGGGNPVLSPNMVFVLVKR